jgi:hypothetical protein
MKIISKKKLLILAITTILMVPFIAEASPTDGFEDGPNPNFYVSQQKMDIDKVAQTFVDTCGVNKDEVISYMNEGVRFRDISMGAFVAKVSDKSLKEVMDVKMQHHDWKGVFEALNISKEKIKTFHNEMIANLLKDQLSIPKNTSQNLLNKGYQPRDIAIANALAKDANKSIDDVLAMRTLTNTWEDVASTLGVTDDLFKKDMDSLQTIIFQHGQFSKD